MLAMSNKPRTFIKPPKILNFLCLLLLLDFLTKFTFSLDWDFSNPGHRILTSYKEIEPFIQTYTKSDTGNYSVLLNDPGTHSIILGARDYLIRLSIDGLEEIESITLPSDPKALKQCLVYRNGPDKEECSNYIRILYKHDKKIFVCGTNSIDPSCAWHQANNLRNSFDTMDGKGRGPYASFVPAASLFDTVKGNYYIATWFDLTGRDAYFYRSLGPDPFLRTVQHSEDWLKRPEFVAMFDIGDYVYTFFREIGKEAVTNNLVYSRVSRVCKNDKGGTLNYDNIWMTYRKARISCPVSIPKNDDTHNLRDNAHNKFNTDFVYLKEETTILLDALIDIHFDPQNNVFLALFEDPLSKLQAICAYNLSTIEYAFYGPYAYQMLNKEPSVSRQTTYKNDIGKTYQYTDSSAQDYYWVAKHNPYPGDLLCQARAKAYTDSIELDKLVNQASYYQTMKRVVLPLTIIYKSRISGPPDNNFKHMLVHTMFTDPQNVSYILYLLSARGYMHKLAYNIQSFTPSYTASTIPNSFGQLANVAKSKDQACLLEIFPIFPEMEMGVPNFWNAGKNRINKRHYTNRFRGRFVHQNTKRSEVEGTDALLAKNRINKMYFSYDTKSIFVLTSSTVLKIPLARCERHSINAILTTRIMMNAGKSNTASRHKPSDSQPYIKGDDRTLCVTSGDPYCGWDGLANACTSKPTITDRYWEQNTVNCSTEKFVKDTMNQLTGYRQYHGTNSAVKYLGPTGTESKTSANIIHSQDDHNDNNYNNAAAADAPNNLYTEWSEWRKCQRIVVDPQPIKQLKKHKFESEKSSFNQTYDNIRTKNCLCRERYCIADDDEDQLQYDYNAVGSPSPANSLCPNDNPEIQITNCTVDGSWTDWSTWSPCSHPCGVATQFRTRSCTNPRPAFGGQNCTGIRKEYRQCEHLPSCADLISKRNDISNMQEGVGGKWLPWSKWQPKCPSSSGSAFCEIGVRDSPRKGSIVIIQNRTRLCQDGKTCVGNDVEYRMCPSSKCPITPDQSNFNAAPWTDWMIVNFTNITPPFPIALPHPHEPHNYYQIDKGNLSSLSTTSALLKTYMHQIRLKFGIDVEPVLDSNIMSADRHINQLPSAFIISPHVTTNERVCALDDPMRCFMAGPLIKDHTAIDMHDDKGWSDWSEWTGCENFDRQTIYTRNRDETDYTSRAASGNWEKRFRSCLTRTPNADECLGSNTETRICGSTSISNSKDHFENVELLNDNNRITNQFMLWKRQYDDSRAAHSKKEQSVSGDNHFDDERHMANSIESSGLPKIQRSIHHRDEANIKVNVYHFIGGCVISFIAGILIAGVVFSVWYSRNYRKLGATGGGLLMRKHMLGGLLVGNGGKTGKGSDSSNEYFATSKPKSLWKRVLNFGGAARKATSWPSNPKLQSSINGSVWKVGGVLRHAPLTNTDSSSTNSRNGGPANHYPSILGNRLDETALYNTNNNNVNNAFNNLSNQVVSNMITNSGNPLVFNGRNNQGDKTAPPHYDETILKSNYDRMIASDLVGAGSASYTPFDMPDSANFLRLGTQQINSDFYHPNRQAAAQAETELMQHHRGATMSNNALLNPLSLCKHCCEAQQAGKHSNKLAPNANNTLNKGHHLYKGHHAPSGLCDDCESKRLSNQYFQIPLPAKPVRSNSTLRSPIKQALLESFNEAGHQRQPPGVDTLLKIHNTSGRDCIQPTLPHHNNNHNNNLLDNSIKLGGADHQKVISTLKRYYAIHQNDPLFAAPADTLAQMMQRTTPLSSTSTDNDYIADGQYQHSSSQNRHLANGFNNNNTSLAVKPSYHQHGSNKVMRSKSHRLNPELGGALGTNPLFQRAAGALGIYEQQRDNNNKNNQIDRNNGPDSAVNPNHWATSNNSQRLVNNDVNATRFNNVYVKAKHPNTKDSNSNSSSNSSNNKNFFHKTSSGSSNKDRYSSLPRIKKEASFKHESGGGGRRREPLYHPHVYDEPF